MKNKVKIIPNKNPNK